MSSPNHLPVDSPTPTISRRRLLIFALIGCCIFFVVSYSGRLIQLLQTQQEVAVAQLRIEKAKEKQLVLQAQLEAQQDPTAVEKIPREELGLARPHDTIVVIVDDDRVPAAVAEVQAATHLVYEDSRPNWQRWVSLFLPSER